MASGKFPPFCRVFIGNLAAEKTSVHEIERIFSKHGRLAEPPVLRRSFGFVQYDDPRAAQAAIEKENGTVIGGLRIDVNMADNRAVRSKEERRADRNAGNKREREERMPPRGDSRRHKGDDFSRSEFRGRDRDPRGDFRSGGGGGSRDPRAPFEPPSNLIDVFVVRVDNAGRSYCLFVEENITNLNLLYEMREVDLPDLPEALKTAAEKSQVKHIMVVGGRHEHTETVTLGTRLPSGKVEEFREMPVQQAFRQLAGQVGPSPSGHASMSGGGQSGRGNPYGPPMRDPRPPVPGPNHGASPLPMQTGRPMGPSGQGSSVRGGPLPMGGSNGPVPGPYSASSTSMPGGQSQPKMGSGMQPGAVNDMLQSLIQQVQNSGGISALSNESTRAQVLQALQSNPQLVQALVQKMQSGQLPSAASFLSSAASVPGMQPSSSVGGLAPAPHAHPVASSYPGGSYSAGLPPQPSASASGMAGQSMGMSYGGMEGQLMGGGQSASPSLDVNSLKDLLAATAPLLGQGSVLPQSSQPMQQGSSQLQPSSRAYESETSSASAPSNADLLSFLTRGSSGAGASSSDAQGYMSQQPSQQPSASQAGRSSYPPIVPSGRPGGAGPPGAQRFGR